MAQIRYEMATGRVNLITHRKKKEVKVEGCQYLIVEGYPHFAATETLYVKNGKIIAIDDTRQPPLHRIIG